MSKRSNAHYLKEFRNETVKMVIENGLSAYEASRQLSLSESTVENWARAHETGKLVDIGREKRPLTEVK